jgi:hypothetical protein
MDGAVRLKLARLGFFSGGGFSGAYAPITAKVRNIAFAKTVVVHYTPDDSTWKDFPLAFAAHYGDYDLFAGEVGEQVVQFVLRYTVDGQTFYDNNAGYNYRLLSTLAVVGGNVTLYAAKARVGQQAGGGFVFTTSWLEGEILVNNLSYVKAVGVRLSADGGATWHDTPATYVGTQTSDGRFIGPNAEAWKFKTPELNMNNAAAEFRFAVFYRNGATGETFWDNNFGQDYKVNKADGTTIG